MALPSAGKYRSPFFSSVRRLPPTNRTASAPSQLGADREVVREHRPGLAAVHARLGDVEAAHVNAVEPEERQQARGGARRPPRIGNRYLGHAEPPLQDRAGAVAPVV